MSVDTEALVREAFMAAIDVHRQFAETALTAVRNAAAAIARATAAGNKVLAFGNGGSAGDAEHLVSELVGRFEVERRGLPAVALTRSEEHTSELQSQSNLVCRLLLEKKKIDVLIK